MKHVQAEPVLVVSGQVSIPRAPLFPEVTPCEPYKKVCVLMPTPVHLTSPTFTRFGELVSLPRIYQGIAFNGWSRMAG